MAKGLVKDSTLTAIANAIREKTETTATMLPSEMAALIAGITGAKVAYGTVTYTDYQSTRTITHGLGVIPNLFIMFSDSSTNYATLSDRCLVNALLPDGRSMYMKKSSSNVGIYNGTYHTDITATTIKVSVSGYLCMTNTWVAGVVE